MIDCISIKNFKSIQEARVNFTRFNSIVGLNGSGKTNLLSVISFLRDLTMGKEMVASYQKISIIPRELLNKTLASNQFSVSLVLSNKENNRYLLDVTFELIESSPQSTSTFIISHEKLEKFNGDNSVKVVIYDRTQNGLKNAENKNIPLDVDPSKLVLSQFGDEDAKKAKSIFRGIFIPNNVTIDSRDTIASAASKTLAGLFLSLKQGKKDAHLRFEEIIQKLIPSFNTFVDTDFSTEDKDDKKIDDSTDEAREYLVLFKEKALTGSLSLKALSAGDIRTLYVLAAILNLKPGSTLIIEEIENGIHPKRVNELVDYLDSISRAKDIQVIFTTHSPGVINNLKPSYVIYVDKKIGNGSNFTSLNESRKLAQLQDILNGGIVLTDYLNSGI